MKKFSRNEILNIIHEKNIKFIRLQFTDIFGIPKNIAISSSQIDKAFNNECMFDGSSIEGFTRINESDMYLKPDLDSFVMFPWRSESQEVARLICDVCNSDGTPFQGDPRYILKKVVKDAETLGYDFNVGPECEFFLFKNGINGLPTTETSDNGGYFDLSPIDLGEMCRRDICVALEAMGFEIEASHHEVAEGQHEIDFKFDKVLRSADNVVTFKHVVRTYAKRHNLHATFMPKPLFGINGSGMHTNMSLFKNGENSFFTPDDENQLSQEAYAFIAGLIAHIKGITAIANPLVNSYKRLVPGYEAPVYISWSTSNRSSLIRVPASRGKGTRVELRSPDPSCNPYLEMALCLAAGLDGIKKLLHPPQQINSNIFTLTSEQIKQSNIETLPKSLEEALNEMKADPLIRTVLGEHVFKKYCEGKEREWESFRSRVSQWELKNYFTNY